MGGKKPPPLIILSDLDVLEGVIPKQLQINLTNKMPELIEMSEFLVR